jgi:hypothetical protein
LIDQHSYVELHMPTAYVEDLKIKRPEENQRELVSFGSSVRRIFDVAVGVGRRDKGLSFKYDNRRNF